MSVNPLIRKIAIGACAAGVMALASPAFAQQSSMRGRVIDEAGNPVEGAKVVIEVVNDDYDVKFEVETNDKGEFFKGALRGYGGVFRLTVTAGELSAAQNNVRVALGEVTSIGDIVVKAGGLDEFKADASNLTEEEIAAENAKTERLMAAFDSANAALASDDFDTAIASVNTVITELEAEERPCAECYAFLGDVNLKKGDDAAAEAAYLKAIEIDPEQAAPYNALAGIYNSQRKFDEAAEMSARAAGMSGAGDAGEAGEGGGAGGGNAEASYNQGISLWNAGKAAEAQAAFERAIQQDSNMADAHYWLGMAFVNQGKLKEAKTPFETYLKLAPEGENAATAKALLAQIGG
jgi:tetratricopeptide (TPR) repeat protein